jgi:hypothetical protein
MSKAAQAAAMERLRYLRDDFRDIGSPASLLDAMAEAGCVLAQLILQGCVPADDFFKDQSVTALQDPVPRWDTEPSAMTRQQLFRMYADDYSDEVRTVFHTTHASSRWVLHRSTQAADQTEPTVTKTELPPTAVIQETRIGTDYEQQGRRYALFISELLARLQTEEPGSPDAAPDPKQSSTAKQKPNKRTRTDPDVHINKLRQKIAAEGYVYPGNYKELTKQIGGSEGTWTNIFKNPENADLAEWKENRGVHARNYQAAVEQVACEPEEFLPDDELETLFAEQVKQLPKKDQKVAWEQFRNMEPDTQRKYILGTRS